MSSHLLRMSCLGILDVVDVVEVLGIRFYDGALMLNMPVGVSASECPHCAPLGVSH